MVAKTWPGSPRSSQTRPEKGIKQGQRKGGRRLLGNVYDRVTEGFDILEPRSNHGKADND
jgi:hypothetical protein